MAPYINELTSDGFFRTGLSNRRCPIGKQMPYMAGLIQRRHFVDFYVFLITHVETVLLCSTLELPSTMILRLAGISGRVDGPLRIFDQSTTSRMHVSVSELRASQIPQNKDPRILPESIANSTEPLLISPYGNQDDCYYLHGSATWPRLLADLARVPLVEIIPLLSVSQLFHSNHFRLRLA